MNKVILVGRLARDPELRTTGSGKSVATFSLAVDRRYKAEGQPTADFFNIVAWGKQAETICQYLSKGRQIALTGRLQSRSYDAQDGSKRYVTEVVLEEFDFIGSKNDSAPQNSQPQEDMDLGEDFHLMADDDEVPF
jgi:single-strand DNA-binding protein